MLSIIIWTLYFAWKVQNVFTEDEFNEMKWYALISDTLTFMMWFIIWSL